MASGKTQPPPFLPDKILDLSDRITRVDHHQPEPGGLADVYKCRYRCDNGNKEVAVKAFRFKFSLNNRARGNDKINKMIRCELGIWKRFDHPSIVPFLGITHGFGREGNVSFVSLWMSNGPLHMFLQTHNDYLTDAYRLQLLLDISSGLSYLHSFSSSQPVVHGDLSCNNVLLDNNYTARLTDFGLTSMMEDVPEALAYIRTNAKEPSAIRWATPEQFLVGDIRSTTKSDIYALGNLVFLVLSGKSPWWEVQQDNAVILLLSQGHKPARPESRLIQNEHWALIERCWSSTDQRPPVEEPLRDFLDSQPTKSMFESLSEDGLTFPASVDMDYRTCRASLEHHRMPVIPTSSSQLFRRKALSSFGHSNPLLNGTPGQSDRLTLHRSPFNPVRGPLFHQETARGSSSKRRRWQ